MMASVVHLMANVVHPSEAPDVHDGISSTSVGKYSTPSEAPDLHDRTCSTLAWQMQYTQVRLLKYMMASTVHLMTNAVPQYCS